MQVIVKTIIFSIGHIKTLILLNSLINHSCFEIIMGGPDFSNDSLTYSDTSLRLSANLKKPHHAQR